MQISLKDLKELLLEEKSNGVKASSDSDTIIGRYVIVRTYSAGVFAGILESRNGRECVMRDARRIWYWDGAASLSQLAMEGTKLPENCKFPCAVDRVELLEVIEILTTTSEAETSIRGVPVWKK